MKTPFPVSSKAHKMARESVSASYWKYVNKRCKSKIIRDAVSKFLKKVREALEGAS